MDKMIIFLINEFIDDLENSELYDLEEDKEFQKDRKKLIEMLEECTKKIR